MVTWVVLAEKVEAGASILLHRVNVLVAVKAYYIHLRLYLTSHLWFSTP